MSATSTPSTPRRIAASVPARSLPWAQWKTMGILASSQKLVKALQTPLRYLLVTDAAVIAVS